MKDVNDAAQWMAAALTRWGYKADFTLDSLKEVDRFLDEQAPNGHPKPGGYLSSRDFGPIIFALGAYTGEVMRREGDGEWQGNDNDPHPEISVAVRLKSGAIFWPTQRIMKRYQNGAEDGIYIYGIGILRH